VIAAFAAASLALAVQWTWSLYEDPASVVLSHEAPDTELLRTVFECAPGSGRAKATAYPDPKQPKDRFTLEIPTAGAPFQSFLRTGRLILKAEGGQAAVSVPREHRPKLVQFAKLCG